MEQIEEHLEKKHREDEYKKQTVAQEKEKESVIRFNFQDQLPNEDGQLEEIEKEMDQWCTQDKPIEKEKEHRSTQPVERAQLRHSGGSQLRPSGGPQSSQSGGLQSSHSGGLQLSQSGGLQSSHPGGLQSSHSGGLQSSHSGGLISTQARTPSTLMIWKAQWENERLAWEREEKQRKREAEQRVLEERAAAVDKRTIELEEESKKLQAKRREEEKAALLLREKKLADALKKLVGHGDEK
jgi:hypothetical protein